MADRTTIAVSKETRDALAALGRKGESYETIIRRLMEESGASRPEARKPRV